jgi:prepilin-type N-terminal cleavage/methylation domain-containing protein
MTGGEHHGSMKHEARSRKLPGFSLVEMLIAITLFSIAAVILSQLFISFNQLHRKVANLAVLGQDMRFAMELLVRSARNNQIDYINEPLTGKQFMIRLKTPDGRIMVFMAGTSCPGRYVSTCLRMSVDGGVTYSPITSSRVLVTNFDMYITPEMSPFISRAAGYDNDYQPAVTFNLGLKYMAANPKDYVTLQSQTTVTSRIYAR